MRMIKLKLLLIKNMSNLDFAFFLMEYGKIQFKWCSYETKK